MKTLAFVLLLFPAIVLGCNSNADCPSGSQCVMPGGQPPGMCKGGGPPQQGGPLRGDASGAEGSQCGADSDCSDGMRCMKGRGQPTGVCAHRRDRQPG